jgi:ABC-type transport system involved in cytochrome bd biosynthesis fused ATPase/permease subunit
LYKREKLYKRRGAYPKKFIVLLTRSKDLKVTNNKAKAKEEAQTLEKQKAKKQQENISLHNPWHQFQEYISRRLKYL